MKQRPSLPGLLALLIGVLALLSMAAIQPQQDEFRLSVRRSFGYSSGSQIRGLFSLSVLGAEEKLAAVRFELDGQLMKEVTAAPFSLSFQTDDYPPGWHELRAVVQTTDGRSLTTAARRFQFVTAAEEAQGMRAILGPLLGLLAVIFVGIFGSVFANLRKKPLQLPLGAPRRYGLKGGAICPHCQRPFGLHWWGFNLVAGAYDRCEFCGRWALQKRRSAHDLRAAEAAEQAGQAPSAAPHDRLKEQLDDSRYLDG